MSKKHRIEELERRVRELEARPPPVFTYPYYAIPVPGNPYRNPLTWTTTPYYSTTSSGTTDSPTNCSISFSGAT